MEILFQNENFVIVNKPAGVLSVPSRMGKADPRQVAGLMLEKICSCQIFPVHRLDFEVSGILVFAKNEKAHRAASVWFESKLLRKFYLAKTSGEVPQEKSFQWQAKILRGKKRAYQSPVGKESLTKAKFIESREGQLLWELEPVTGRSHQLRFDLSRHGFPIVGDALYGSTVSLRENEIALKAVRLCFPEKAAAEWLLPSELVIQ